MLTEALGYIASDLTALHAAIASGHYDSALQHVHRLKGTASFLGGNRPTLTHFDQLTTEIKHIANTRSIVGLVATMNSEPIAQALRQIESVMTELDTELRISITDYEDAARTLANTATPTALGL